MPSLKEPRPFDVFQTGTVLNNTYEIKGVLGRGGTGEVYLAQHQIVDREMAIKVLNSVFSGNDDYLQLMKREEQMRMIVHDAVVRYNECSRTDQGHVYLVMDFIDGPSLHDLMNERAVSADELMVIARRVLEGLVATHAQGVVHRDLSPDNIILREGRPDKATIIDFGIAKDTSTGAKTIVGNDFAGKYEYAAPEQLEGQATEQSDLYALGASLLAAYRQKTPDMGASPGEVYRNKQNPLDLDGVPGALADFIRFLSAPDVGARAKTASAALERLAGVSAGQEGTDAAPTVIAQPGKTTKPPKAKAASSKEGNSKLVPVLGALVFLLAGLGGGFWFLSGGSKPPLVSPYVFAASFGEGGADLSGNAPSPEAAEQLASAFGAVAGVPVTATDLSVARGAPSDLWPEQAATLLQLMSPLENWSVSLSDATGRLSGFAANVLLRDNVISSVENWSSSAGIAMTYDVLAGPRILTAEDLQVALNSAGTCGLLSQEAGPGTTYGLGDKITITGDLAKPRDADTLRLTLSEVVGDRTLEFKTNFLNDDLCAIRAVLPPITMDFDIRLIDGATNVVSQDGVFRTGQHPVVDVELPATLDDGFLWVMVVDNTSKVFHILPNASDGEQSVPRLGQIEGDTRRVRVLWSEEDAKADPSRIAVEVTEGDYGKSEVLAIISRVPLFDLRRPRDENIVSVAEALKERLAGRDDLIIGIAAQTIDARP